MSLYIAWWRCRCRAVFLTIAGGILFGWLVGGLAVVVGATIGATLWSHRAHALADFVRRRLGPRPDRHCRRFPCRCLQLLLFLRLVPVFPSFCHLAGACEIGVGTFVAATFLAFFRDIRVRGLRRRARQRDCRAGGRLQACLAAGGTDCRLNFDVRAALTPQLLAA